MGTFNVLTRNLSLRIFSKIPTKKFLLLGHVQYRARLKMNFLKAFA